MCSHFFENAREQAAKQALVPVSCVCQYTHSVCVCSTLNIWVCFLSYVTCQALFLKVTFRVTIVSYRPYMLFSHGFDRCHFVVSTSRRRFQRPLSFPQTDGVFSNRCRFHKTVAFSATAVVSTKRLRFEQPLSFPQNGCVFSSRCRFQKPLSFASRTTMSHEQKLDKWLDGAC